MTPQSINRSRRRALAAAAAVLVFVGGAITPAAAQSARTVNQAGVSANVARSSPTVADLQRLYPELRGEIRRGAGLRANLRSVNGGRAVFAYTASPEGMRMRGTIVVTLPPDIALMSWSELFRGIVQQCLELKRQSDAVGNSQGGNQGGACSVNMNINGNNNNVTVINNTCKPQ